MGIDVSRVKNFKAPLPARGKVRVAIVSVTEQTGKDADKNGEKSKGFLARYKIVGPDTAVMNDGGSALGYTFDERLWLPRQSWMDKDPQSAARAEAKVAKRLQAWFGSEDAIPDSLDNAELKAIEGVELAAVISTKFDDFADDDIVVIQELKPIEASAEGDY